MHSPAVASSLVMSMGWLAEPFCLRHWPLHRLTPAPHAPIVAAGTMSLRIPISIDDFRELRQGGFTYVDKSHLIRELIDRSGVKSSCWPDRDVSAKRSTSRCCGTGSRGVRCRDVPSPQDDS